MAAAAVFMVRFQIPWARKHLFDSDLGERTGGSAPVPPPIANEESSVWSGRLFGWLGALLLLGYR